jgi:hypothetical protein
VPVILRKKEASLVFMERTFCTWLIDGEAVRQMDEGRLEEQ